MPSRRRQSNVGEIKQGNGQQRPPHTVVPEARRLISTQHVHGTPGPVLTSVSFLCLLQGFIGGTEVIVKNAGPCLSHFLIRWTDLGAWCWRWWQVAVRGPSGRADVGELKRKTLVSGVFRHCSWQGSPCYGSAWRCPSPHRSRHSERRLFNSVSVIRCPVLSVPHACVCKIQI